MIKIKKTTLFLGFLAFLSTFTSFPMKEMAQCDKKEWENYTKNVAQEWNKGRYKIIEIGVSKDILKPNGDLRGLIPDEDLNCLKMDKENKFLYINQTFMKIDEENDFSCLIKPSQSLFAQNFKLTRFHPLEYKTPNILAMKIQASPIHKDPTVLECVAKTQFSEARPYIKVAYQFPLRVNKALSKHGLRLIQQKDIVVKKRSDMAVIQAASLDNNEVYLVLVDASTALHTELTSEEKDICCSVLKKRDPKEEILLHSNGKFVCFYNKENPKITMFTLLDDEPNLNITEQQNQFSNAILKFQK